MSSNEPYQKVCDLDDVWEGEMEVFDVASSEVLIVHAPDGVVRAFNPICPHQDHPLVEGEFEKCVLTCSAHLWQFDVITGEGINPTGTSLDSYPVKVENDAIWVVMPEE